MTTRNSPVAVVSSRGAQRLREGKVWVYRSDTVELPERPGLYPVLDVRERTLGWALVNAASEISVRLLTRGEESADEQLITARLDAALAYRSSLKLSADAHRLVHAEADGLPGLVVDRYGDVLVVQNGTAALEPYLGVIVDALVRRLQPRGVLARHEGRVRTLEGLESGTYTLYGEVPDKLTVHEPSARGEVKYLVDPYRGQKTGAFLDQRENRLLLGQYAWGQALDVFSYHGSFGLHLAGQAEHVELIDASAPALARARENMELNGFGNVTYSEANAFDRLRELKREGGVYGAISLDPPALAKLKKDLPNAYRAYKELNLRALRLLDVGGVLGTTSCSFHVSESEFYGMLQDAAADAGVRVRVLARRGQAMDHPELLGVAETRYLKFALVQRLG
ncbi:class I SAM-dependent rRNA methyltransferase [Deinococcus peraridilitoris]|uniref:Putative SAM-dependent methyltransferase n=1 Tax=Deinococcus peraridilitoris (strain DSM 19664 / LMG 22246 / CIP 109416 / KR-200) TaxID=937777 RepID=K9ZYB3_DEIPD|nr:class I SAM-dependent rRNA methyltransferase [Deinococcus peraridilitoris]AFZ66628.1 putative SAM-dependent methyltransferase [Deinococcus peraridilitoris DSM 19664]